jgi:hypothetical protein
VHPLSFAGGFFEEYFLTDSVSDRVTIKEACLLVGCGRKTIYRWLERGLLVREKAGANAYVSLCAVRSLYASIGPGVSAVSRVSDVSPSDVSDVSPSQNSGVSRVSDVSPSQNSGVSRVSDVSPSQSSGVSRVSPPPISSFIVERTHYEGLLVRLGQLEAEKKYLLEYQTNLAATSKELAEAKELLRSQREQLAAQSVTISVLTEDIEKSSKRWWLRLRGFFSWR